jgi:hypothetical protein
VAFSITKRSEQIPVANRRWRLMTRRKSKAIEIERNFPHIVEIELPKNGLDVDVSHRMTIFHRLRDIRPQFGHKRTKANHHFCRWCFSDSSVADTFCAEFGGERIMRKR